MLLKDIWLDVKAVQERDPAARSALEVLLLYQGVHALIWHRIAHWFWTHNMRFLGRLISQIARFFTLIEIHPGAVLGRGILIDHGCGIVIGETTIIGDDVTLFQGVTLGGTGKEKGKRHPTLEDYVVVACGAKVLGSFTVGEGAKIGAGSVVLKPVPPHSTVVGIPGQVISSRGISPLHIDNDEEEVDLDHSELPDPIKEKITNLKEQVALLEERLTKLEGNDESR